MDRDHNTLAISLQDSGRVRHITNFDPSIRSSISVYQPEQRDLALGDRVQFTTPWSKKGIASRDTALVESLDPNGNIAVRLDSNRRVAWNLKDFNHLDYAYAMTSHSSQGMTVDRVLTHYPANRGRVLANQSQLVNYPQEHRWRVSVNVTVDNQERKLCVPSLLIPVAFGIETKYSNLIADATRYSTEARA